MEDFIKKSWKHFFTLGFIALLAMNVITSVISGFFLKRVEEKYSKHTNKNLWVWFAGFLIVAFIGSLVYVGTQTHKHYSNK